MNGCLTFLLNKTNCIHIFVGKSRTFGSKKLANLLTHTVILLTLLAIKNYFYADANERSGEKNVAPQMNSVASFQQVSR